MARHDRRRTRTDLSQFQWNHVGPLSSFCLPLRSNTALLSLSLTLTEYPGYFRERGKTHSTMKNTLAIRLAESVVFLRAGDATGRFRNPAGEPPSMLRGILVINLAKATKITSIELQLTCKSSTAWPEGMSINPIFLSSFWRRKDTICRNCGSNLKWCSVRGVRTVTVCAGPTITDHYVPHMLTSKGLSRTVQDNALRGWGLITFKFRSSSSLQKYWFFTLN